MRWLRFDHDLNHHCAPLGDVVESVKVVGPLQMVSKTRGSTAERKETCVTSGFESDNYRFTVYIGQPVSSAFALTSECRPAHRHFRIACFQIDHRMLIASYCCLDRGNLEHLIIGDDCSMAVLDTERFPVFAVAWR